MIYNHMIWELLGAKFLILHFADEEIDVESCLAIALTLYKDFIKMPFMRDKKPYCSWEELCSLLKVLINIGLNKLYYRAFGLEEI